MYSADHIIQAKYYLVLADDGFARNNSREEIYYLEKAKEQIEEALKLANQDC